MHNPESTQKNGTHKLLWDFKRQTDNLISARRPDPVLIKNKKENLPNRELCRSFGPQGKTGGKRKEG